MLILLLSAAAMKAVRMIGPYGYFWIPLSTYTWGRWMQYWPGTFRKIIEIGLLVAGIVVSAYVNFDWNQKPVAGIAPDALNAVDFFKQEHLKGPVFNDYDNGGYLILYLSPGEKLFVDDRQEAFPGSFFKDIFIPMQVEDTLWQQMDEKYHFNVIFFIPETTPWGVRFLKKRLNDPAWALVFWDKGSVIFLRRNAQNADTIRLYEKHLTLTPPTKLYGYIM